MTEAEFLDLTKQQQGDALIQHLNALTARALQIYPEAEKESWPLQKIEAQLILDAGYNAELNMAPLIARVCYYHHGESDDESRLAQVKAKAAAINANAVAWSEVVAFVNGTRARTQDEIAAATTIGEVLNIMNNMRIAVDMFRMAAGI